MQPRKTAIMSGLPVVHYLGGVMYKLQSGVGMLICSMAATEALAMQMATLSVFQG